MMIVSIYCVYSFLIYHIYYMYTLIRRHNDRNKSKSNSAKSNTISHCPALHSSGAVRNLCTSFVALTSSCDQVVVYVRYTSIDIALPVYFFFVFCSITIFVVCYYLCGE